MWKCNKCGAENEESVMACQSCESGRDVIEDTTENASNEEKSNKKRNLIIGGILAGILVIGLIILLVSSLTKQENSKSENYTQIMENNPEITEKGVAFQVNGMQVNDTAWNYYLMSAAANYANEFGAAIEDIDWNKKNDTGETALEQIKYDAMKTVISNASAVSFADVWEITLTESDKSIIDVDLDYWKQIYGDDVYKALNVKDEKNYRELYENVLLQRKVINAVVENPEKYIPGVDLAKYANDNSATVKMMGMTKGEDEVTTNKAKNAVEEMKKRLDGGEKFDKVWLENYQEMTGMTAEEPTVETIYKDGNTEKNVEKAALALKVGEISEIVETEYSYVIIMRVAGYTEVENYVIDESDININKSMIDGSKVK